MFHIVAFLEPQKIQQHIPNTQKHLSRSFANLMFEGKTKAAICLLMEEAKGGLLRLSDHVDTNWTVRDVLQQHIPNTQKEALANYSQWFTHYSIPLFPKFQPFILSNQPVILNYFQSITNNGENIIPLAITKNGTCNSLFIIMIASLQIVGYSLLRKIPVVCQTFSYVMWWRQFHMVYHCSLNLPIKLLFFFKLTLWTLGSVH